MGDGERQRGAEPVQRADEVHVARQETRIGANPAKTTSDSQGVLKLGWSWRKSAGICRYVAIEYVMRDAPMMPAFVATMRIVAARMPT